MIDLSKRLKEEVSSFTVPDRLIEETIKRAKSESVPNTFKKRNKFFTFAAVLALCLIVSGSAFAGVLIYQNIYINGEALPELDAMETYSYYEVDGLQPSGTTPVIYSREYKDIHELIDGIHKDLLIPTDADTEYQSIYYETDKKDYEYIRCQFSSSIGTGRTTIESQIFIALSDSQIRSFSQDLLGDYTFEKEGVTENGNKVIIASSGTVNRIIFVADGILYQLEAPVSADELIEYVNDIIK